MFPRDASQWPLVLMLDILISLLHLFESSDKKNQKPSFGRDLFCIWKRVALSIFVWKTWKQCLLFVTESVSSTRFSGSTTTDACDQPARWGFWTVSYANLWRRQCQNCSAPENKWTPGKVFLIRIVKMVEKKNQVSFVIFRIILCEVKVQLLLH